MIMQPMEEFDLIDKYLRNEMTPEEAGAFEKTLAHNEALRKEVEIRYDIMVGIRASEQKHILQELDKIDNHIAISKPKGSPSYAQKLVKNNHPQPHTRERFTTVVIVSIVLVIFIILLILKFVFNVF